MCFQQTHNQGLHQLFWSVLGPLGAAHLLTMFLFLCISVRNTWGQWRALEGRRVSSKRPSRFRDRDKGVAGAEEKNSPIRGHCFCFALQSNRWFRLKLSVNLKTYLISVKEQRTFIGQNWKKATFHSRWTCQSLPDLKRFQDAISPLDPRHHDEHLSRRNLTIQ